MAELRKFKCAACGEEFESERSDASAHAEAALAFPDEDIDDMAVVCDDCWMEMRRTMPEMDAAYPPLEASDG
jgi:hypothetical protein